MKTVVEITEMDHFGGIGFFFLLSLLLLNFFICCCKSCYLIILGKKKKKDGNLCIATDDVLKGMLEAHR